MRKGSAQSTSATPPVAIPATSNRYRPRDYFGRYDLQTELLTRVKGTARRNALRAALDEGQIAEVPGSIKSAALTQVARQEIGRIHPALMGGEYLPTVDTGEVEIARICINSTTGDVISLYARVVGKRIAYRMVDEYQGDTLSGVTQRTSVRPLSMGQLVDFFLGAWDLYVCLECNYEDDLEGMLRFFRGESEFYPCFDAELRQRVRERFSHLAEAAEED